MAPAAVVPGAVAAAPVNCWAHPADSAAPGDCRVPVVATALVVDSVPVPVDWDSEPVLPVLAAVVPAGHLRPAVADSEAVPADSAASA